ncbi:MAG: RNA polymerase, sigma-24 subunit, ECF subfamily [Berkelbacteria bacterium GW2011_GWA2_35_9]|uniref:RNA polymerase sigma factor n=1 Tax=Berkelbacteria bacterium GW2011_GWA2_35_9 TaxID=1618333 RepID=A0A0G0D4K0_9BACT|nr:MAG: RNA polymerase, sigma-24 subunit, ECF subfamily [Berkelbacteria bacterium GW2011_GWA2_35_9]
MDTKKRLYISQKIISQAKNGNDKAFEIIVSTCERAIYNFIFRMVQRKEDAEDLTQETFLKIYKNIKKYNPEYKFTTWIFTIAQRTVYDFLRKKRKTKELYIIDDKDNPFETPDKSSAYNNRDYIIDISRSLQKLDYNYKSVLWLHYWEGLSYKEIGATMRLPINTVKTYLHRAKEKLKTQLGKEYYEKH